MKKSTKKLPLIIGLSLAVVVYALLLIFEKELLFRSQELNLWLPTKMWFAQRMAAPAGMLSVLSSFFTQFTYFPWLGALLLVGLWALVFQLVCKVFTIPSNRAGIAFIPVALLIGCAMEMGYWLFLVKTQGYLFSATVAVLFMLAAVLAWQSLRKPLWQYLFLVVLFAVGFPLFGFYTLFAGLLIALLAIVRDEGSSRIVTPLLCLIGIAVVPFVYYYAYTMVRQGWIYLAGLPHFDYTKKQFIFWLPYLLLFISLIVLVFCFRKPKTENVEEVVTPQPQKGAPKGKKKANQPKLSRETKATICWNTGAIVVAAVLAFLFWYKDANFHTELKMEAAMTKMDYKKVLNIAEKQKKEPTRLIVMAKNLALMKLGRAGEEMFTYLDGGAKSNTPLDIRMMQVGGKMLYYNYARFNFCYRWCLEDGVEYGWKVEYLKYMAKTSILSSEYEVAQKYINTLSQTWFHKKWAAKYQKYIDDHSLVAKDKEFATILPLYCYGDQLDGDNSLVEIYLLNYFAHSFNHVTTPQFDEAGLMCALVLKDIPTFWSNFFRYAKSHPKDRMPKHFQEAALLFGNLEPGKVDISNMPFEKPVTMKFKAFMEYAKQNAIGDDAERDPVIKQKFYERFGDTYFYFYFFIRDVKSY